MRRSTAQTRIGEDRAVYNIGVCGLTDPQVSECDRTYDVEHQRARSLLLYCARGRQARANRSHHPSILDNEADNPRLIEINGGGQTLIVV